MKSCILTLLALTSIFFATAQYTFNKAPLQKNVYAPLPLGSIKAKGWLLKQLELQRDGFTGHAEELYAGADELGPDTDWLGGKGNSWEKVPYYVKGLVALAYTLDDATLKAKAEKWMHYTLAHQQDSGLFGPPKMKDWWPRMPFMYALQGYYEATNDQRVIPFLSKYFKYQLQQLDQEPLRDWGKSRAGDNMELALWVYNKTGESWLLELVNKLKQQAYPWNSIFNNNGFFYYGDDFQPKHMVNVAQALKFPVVYSQLDSSAEYRNAMQKGIQYIRRDNGQPHGLGSGSEFMSGKSSVEGVETCTVVEWMQSLETASRIIHDAHVGDDLEKIAFNALPAQFSRDLKQHSYYTLPNQVVAVNGPHRFGQDYGNGTVLSPYSGFPCCRYNMHMGWPYFVKNSCMATPDGGIAFNTYGPMEINAVVGKNTPVKIIEETAYPFEEQIRFRFELKEAVSFPVVVRIPAWCKKPMITLQGKVLLHVKPGQLFTINRKWMPGDLLVLMFPMETVVEKQVNNAVSVHRGPLVYALKMKQAVVNKKEFAVKGFYETEITPAGSWNYGLVDQKFSFRQTSMPENPFDGENSPVWLLGKAKLIPSWTLDYNQTAAFDVPYSPVSSDSKVEEITLVPYGSQNIRLSVFPVIGSAQTSNRSFKESFENNTANGWVVYGSSWFYKDNAIHCASNGNNSSGDAGSKFVATGTNFSNFVYSADVSVNSSGDAGLIFRVSKPAIGADAYQGYYVGLNAAQGEVTLGKASNNKWVVMATVKQSLSMKQTYKVTVKAVGDQFQILLNDASVLTASDNEYQSGNIGLRAYRALATVDNIVVEAK